MSNGHNKQSKNKDSSTTWWSNSEKTRWPLTNGSFSKVNYKTLSPVLTSAPIEGSMTTIWYWIESMPMCCFVGSWRTIISNSRIDVKCGTTLSQEFLQVTSPPNLPRFIKLLTQCCTNPSLSCHSNLTTPSLGVSLVTSLLTS